MGLMADLQPSLGRALVVGGGTIAVRKVTTLRAADFEVTVIAPLIAPEIRDSGAALVEREWEPGDIAPGRYALVFACTDERAVNRAVGETARTLGIPVLVADSQAESTFFSPAILRDGDLQVAVSTGGASPALARAIRERIAASLEPGWAETVAAARAERARRRAGHPPAEEDEA